MAAFKRMGEKTFLWIKTLNCPQCLLQIGWHCSWGLCSQLILGRAEPKVSQWEWGGEKKEKKTFSPPNVTMRMVENDKT